MLRTMAKRRKRKRKTRRKVKYRNAIAALCAVVILLLISINFIIRQTGGNPHLLSPRHTGDKLFALGALSKHWLLHPFVNCGENFPKAYVRQRARFHGVDIQLAVSVAKTESSLLPHQISHTGAMGLMQLMPGTAAELKVRDPFCNHDNIDGGIRYLSRLQKRYRGDLKRTAAAYNAGPGRVARRGKLNLPSETQIYLRRIFSE